MNADDKTAVIMVGGAMKSAHGAGFLWALEKELKLPKPDIMIASSGDAGNAFYYCADQVEQMKRIWIELLSTPKFVSLARFWRIMDVDYLIDEVFKHQGPLDVAGLNSSTTKWFVPVSDFDSGKTLYANVRGGLDPFEILRAAMAIPILFGKQVPLRHRRYIDGELGPILQDHLNHALAQGARHILIINHTRNWTSHNSLPVRLYSHLAAKGMHDAIMRDVSTDVTAYHADKAQVILVSPTKLPCGTATHNAKKIKATFERGIADALALQDELRTLLSV